MRSKKNQQSRLDAARRERDQVRREGIEDLPRIRRLERRVADNHFAELMAAVFRKRKRT